MSNAIFGRLLQTFLDDYNLIKPLDNDKTAYAMTLSTLNNIKSFLEKSDYVTRNYRLRGISKLSKRFIDENKKQKELAL